MHACGPQMFTARQQARPRQAPIPGEEAPFDHRQSSFVDFSECRGGGVTMHAQDSAWHEKRIGHRQSKVSQTATLVR